MELNARKMNYLLLLIDCNNPDTDTILITKLLLDNGGNKYINQRDEYLCTPFLYASGNIYSERGALLVNLLVKYGAYIDTTDGIGDTALMIACKNGKYEVVKALIDNGANIKVKNRFDENALMIACRYGKENVVKLLIENGGDEIINIQDKKHLYSPLMCTFYTKKI